MTRKDEKPHGSKRSQARAERREKRAHARDQHYAAARQPTPGRAR